VVSGIDPERLDFLRRNSRVHLDKEGGWTFDGRPVENDRVAQLFHQGTRRGDAPGEYILQVGKQWCFIEHVEDTAFFLAKWRRPGTLALVGELLGGETVTVPPNALTQASDTMVYATLLDGRRARLLRDAMAGLGAWMTERDGVLGVAVDGAFYPIRAE